MQVKRSSVFSLLLRAYRICDLPYLQNEINFLYQSFRKVGFPTHIIDSVHSGVKQKIYNNQPQQDVEYEQRPTISLPLNQFGHKYVTPVFRAQKYRVVNSSNNNLKSMIVCNKPPPDRNLPDKASGVYKIPCKDCDEAYYGETGREFGVRLREHKDAVRRGNNNYATFKHSFNKRHDIDWENAKIIYKSDNHYNRLIVESTYIQTQPNYNNLHSTLAIDNLSANIILRSNPNINPSHSQT